MLIDMRNALMAGKSLPYDAEVEYLESTGTQWIDTGIMPNQDTRVKVSFSVSFDISLGGSGREVFGARSGGRYYELLLDTSGYYYYYQYGTSTLKMMIASDNLEHYESWYTDKNTVRDITGDVLANAPAQTFSIANTLYLFGLNDGSAARLLRGRIRYCLIYSNFELVRDFIPVRFTNELGQTEGAMYDRANPTVGMNPDGSARDDGLYRNRGTGSFSWGNDI